MTFGNDTVIEPCDEVDSIPQLNISLCPLNEISNKNEKDIVGQFINLIFFSFSIQLFASFKDIIGIVKSVGELSNIVVKSTGKDLLKREIQIVDDSNYAINATLWGKQVRLLL